MRPLARRAVGVGILVGAACLAYRYALSDQAKTNIKQCARTAKAAYERVTEVVEDMTGQVMGEEGPLPNQQATAAQWESLGY